MNQDQLSDFLINFLMPSFGRQPDPQDTMRRRPRAVDSMRQSIRMNTARGSLSDILKNIGGATGANPGSGANTNTPSTNGGGAAGGISTPTSGGSAGPAVGGTGANTPSPGGSSNNLPSIGGGGYYGPVDFNPFDDLLKVPDGANIANYPSLSSFLAMG